MGETKSRATPGPWATDGERVYSMTERGTIDRTVSDCTPAPEDEDGGDAVPLPEAHANAQLIAAAPDLLAACEHLLTPHVGGKIDPATCFECHACVDVLAKARGDA